MTGEGSACVCRPGGSLPHDILRAFVLSESDESAVPQVTSGVHSTNSNWPTSEGTNQRQSRIFSAVSPAPERPDLFSGIFAKGHSLVSRGLNRRINSVRSF